jgi:putative membrane protein
MMSRAEGVNPLLERSWPKVDRSTTEVSITTDAWLAIAHHLAVFSLLAVLASEWGLVRRGMRAVDIRRLARIDAAYGGVAAAVVIVGVSRVIWGAKPAAFYLESVTFWLKMAALVAVGLLSIRPTIRYAGWRRALDQNASSLPSDQEVGSARRMINVQLAVFVLIPTFAALMARGIG